MSDPMHEHPAEEDLHLYLDGELPEDESGRLQAHFGRCASCAAELESLRSLFRRIEDLPETALQRDLTPGVIHRLDEQRGSRRRWGWILAIQTLVFAGAALLLSGSILSQIQGWVQLLQGWLAQTGFQADLQSLAGQLKQSVLQLKPGLEGVLELSLPTPYSPPDPSAWAAVGVGVSLVWLLLNRWLLSPSSVHRAGMRGGSSGSS